MSVSKFVDFHTKVQRIRDEAKQTKKELVAEAKEAEEILVDLLLAAGLTSAEAGEDFVVLKKKKMAAKLSKERVQSVLEKIDEREMRLAASNGTEQSNQNNLLHSLRSFARSKLLSENDEEDESEEAEAATTGSLYTLSVQPNKPLNFLSPPPATSRELANATKSYIAADRAKRVFNGKLKEMIEEATAGIDTSACELAAFDYVATDTSSKKNLDSVEGGVAYRQITKDDGGDAGESAVADVEEKLYVRAQTKLRPRTKIGKKRFLEIVDDSVQEFVTTRFGSTTTVDESRLREVEKNANEILTRVENKLGEGGLEVVRSVSVTTKVPRKRNSKKATPAPSAAAP